MTTQDPELSAALGWPGGIGDPVLDRAQLLRMVAALRLSSQQALEFLDAEFGWSPGEAPSIDALRSALAQQAEPAREWVSMDEYKRLQGLVTSQGIRLMEYESKQPQQAEPVEPVATLTAQRDALLEALQDLCDTLGECGMTERARAAIKAVEEKA